MAVDIERSTTRTDPAKAQLRQAMYELFEDALLTGGIINHHDSLIDRGDGVLALIHPVDQVPKTVLLSTVIPRLSSLLTDCDAAFPQLRLRLRAVLHAGEIHYDGWGCYGEPIDLACRLLDAPEVKGRLRRTRKPLVAVISDEIYRSLVRHGYNGIDRNMFTRSVQVKLSGQWHRGWVYVPNHESPNRLADRP